MGPRKVEPEWLDELPARDSRALRSRRDLRRVNAWMGQARIMRRLLAQHVGGTAPRSIVELGCGDGTFMLEVARGLARRWPGAAVTLVDRQEIVREETLAAFLARGWQTAVVTADVSAFLQSRPRADIVVANLFLHHFEDAALARLLAMAAEVAPLFVACEPRRSGLALVGSRSLWAIGCNDVSRHDAVASVRAGFSGYELSGLWPERQGWALCEHPAGLFTHCFVARANDGP
jgi:hypothetical protein